MNPERHKLCSSTMNLWKAVWFQENTILRPKWQYLQNPYLHWFWKFYMKIWRFKSLLAFACFTFLRKSCRKHDNNISTANLTDVLIKPYFIAKYKQIQVNIRLYFKLMKKSRKEIYILCYIVWTLKWYGHINGIKSTICPTKNWQEFTKIWILT